jgi:phasin family protein
MTKVNAKATPDKKSGNKKEATSSAKASNNNQNFFEQAKKMQEQMKKINPFNDHAEKMADNMGDKMKTSAKFGIDKERILDMHRKNMEALNEANTMAVNVMKQISQLQGEFMEQTFQEIGEVIQENLNFKKMASGDHMTRNKNVVTSAVERAFKHSTSISQIMLKSNQELFKNVQNRFEEGMKEMQENINKTKH